MLQGVLYPHWANSPNFGVGEPRFVFYPPLTWMAGALMGLVMPWKSVALAMCFLLLAATGLANRALAREVLADGPATLAGCASIFLGRSLSDMTRRSGYAELTGGFWIPLLLLFLLRNRNPSGSLWTRIFDGSVVPLSLVIAGIWLSNGPLGIEATYLLAATALVSAMMQKSWAPIARATIAASLGMGVASVYLAPAVWERSSANIQLALSAPGYQIENNWLFSHLADPSLSTASLAAHNVLTFSVSVIAVAMFVVTLTAFLVAWKRGALPGDREWWLPLALIPLATFFLLFPISQPVWNLLPALKFLQFPWRWLLVLQTPLALFFASAVWSLPRRRRPLILGACMALFFAAGTTAWLFSFENCNTFDSNLRNWEEQGGAAGKPEYSPPGIQYELVLPDVPRNCVVRNLNDLMGVSGAAGEGLNPVLTQAQDLCTGEFSEALNRPERKGIVGIVEQAGYLILPLRSYPAWSVTVNGRPTSTFTEPGHGLLAVPVTPGPVTVIVTWATTRDVAAGRWMTFLALVLLAVAFRVEWKTAPS
jgi:hypothetical protein